MTVATARPVERRRPFGGLAPALAFTCLWALAPPAGAEDPAASAADGTVEVEVVATDGRGGAVAELSAGDLHLLAGGQRKALQLSPVERRHFVLMVDLPTSDPAERSRALPPLRKFLQDRALRGDRVTVVALGRRPKDPAAELLCRFCSRPEAVADALDALGAHRSAGFRALRQRRIEPRRLMEDALRALTRGVEGVAGDGRTTDVLYLGLAATGGLGSVGRPPGDGADPGGGAGAYNAIGSVQYLVTLPRSGLPTSTARGGANRALAAAVEAEVTLHPLVPNTAPGQGSDLWLARETGGESLRLRHLDVDLDRLGRQMDGAYRVAFSSPLEDTFQTLEVRGPESLRLRFRRAYRAQDPDAALASRARAAWRLGGDPGNLSARLVGAETEGRETVVTLELLRPLAPSAPAEGTLTLALAVPEPGKEPDTRLRSLPYRRAEGQTELGLRIPLRLPAGVRGIGVALRDDRTGDVDAVGLELPR